MVKKLTKILSVLLACTTVVPPGAVMAAEEEYTTPVYSYLEPSDFANNANWFVSTGTTAANSSIIEGTTFGIEPNAFKAMNIWDNAWGDGTQNVLTFNGYKYKVNVDTTAGKNVAFKSFKMYNGKKLNIPSGDIAEKTEYYYRFEVEPGYYEGISFLGGLDYMSQMIFAVRLNYSDGSTGFVKLDMSRLRDKPSKNEYIQVTGTKKDTTTDSETYGQVVVGDDMYLSQASLDTDVTRVLTSIDFPVQDAYITYDENGENGVISGVGNNEYTRYDFRLLGIGLKTNAHAVSQYKEDWEEISTPVNIFDYANYTNSKNDNSYAGGRAFSHSGGSGLWSASNKSATVDGTTVTGTQYWTIDGDKFVANESIGWESGWSDLTFTNWKDAAQYKTNKVKVNGITFEVNIPFSKTSSYENVYTNSNWPAFFNGGEIADGSEENGYIHTLDIEDGYYTGVAFMGAQKGNVYIRYVYSDGTKSDWVKLTTGAGKFESSSDEAVAVDAWSWIQASGTSYTVDTTDKVYLHVITNKDVDTSKVVTAIEFPKGNSKITDVTGEPVGQESRFQYNTFYMGMALLTNAKMQNKDLGKDETSDIVIHVSPNGNDKAAGTEGAPVKTIKTAIERAKVQADYSNNTRNIVIELADGEYEATSTITIPEFDGSFTLTASEGAEPIIKGSKTVKLSDMTVSSDERIQSGVSGVLEYSLSDYDLAEMICTSKNSISATNTFGVFSDDEILPIAEYPNNGEMVTDSVYAADNPGTGNAITLTHDKFAAYANHDNSYDWYIEGYIKEKYRTWKSNDFTISGNALTFNSITSSSVYSLYRNWRIFNLLEELDTAGEWYVDKDKKTLYYLPKTGEEEIEISNMNSALLNITGDNVTISGIAFKNTNNNALNAVNADNITIKACSFAAIGRHAIEMTGVTNTTIKNNTLKNIGFRGIVLSDGKVSEGTLTPEDGTTVNYYKLDDLTETNSVVSYNDIEATGKVVRCYAQAINISGVGIRAEHNEIRDILSIAIGYGGAKNKIMYNKLDNVVTEALDAAAIYSGRSWYYLDNEIAYNEVNIAKRDGGNEVISGIYLDDYLSGQKVHHNIVRNATRGVFSNGGVNNDIYNNVFESCTYGVRINKNDTTNTGFNTLVVPTEDAYSGYADILTKLSGDENVSASGIKVYNNYAKGSDEVLNLNVDSIKLDTNSNNAVISDLTEGYAKADLDPNTIGFISDGLHSTIAWADIENNTVTVHFISTYADYSVIAAIKDDDGSLIAIKSASDGESFKFEDVTPASVEFYVFDSLNTIKPMTKK